MAPSVARTVAVFVPEVVYTWLAVAFPETKEPNPPRQSCQHHSSVVLADPPVTVAVKEIVWPVLPELGLALTLTARLLSTAVNGPCETLTCLPWLPTE